MPDLILPEQPENEENQVEELTYPASPEDEERFFLMYHMSFQPSEVEALKPDYRKWLIARFMAQKNLEREAMERHRLMGQIGTNIRT